MEQVTNVYNILKYSNNIYRTDLASQKSVPTEQLMSNPTDFCRNGWIKEGCISIDLFLPLYTLQLLGFSSAGNSPQLGTRSSSPLTSACFTSTYSTKTRELTVLLADTTGDKAGCGTTPAEVHVSIKWRRREKRRVQTPCAYGGMNEAAID